MSKIIKIDTLPQNKVVLIGKTNYVVYDTETGEVEVIDGYCPYLIVEEAREHLGIGDNILDDVKWKIEIRKDPDSSGHN